MLEQIVQLGVGLAQTALEAKVEVAVIGIHSVKVGGVGTVSYTHLDVYKRQR